MFAGIVEELGRINAIQDAAPGKRLLIDADATTGGARVGDSIAVNGCCLTVVRIHETTLHFDAGPETLRRTNLGQLVVDSRVNLERSLVIGDRLGGHFVTGHVDAVGRIESRTDENDWSTFWIKVPDQLDRQMASKGSIAVDGISLTLVDVESQRFSVALIPHTLQVTTLGLKGPGDQVNIETDLLAKYVQAQLK